jgi:hypothetical protein
LPAPHARSLRPAHQAKDRIIPWLSWAKDEHIVTRVAFCPEKPAFGGVSGTSRGGKTLKSGMPPDQYPKPISRRRIFIAYWIE